MAMIVDLRSHARLTGDRPLDVGASLTPVLDALRRQSTDLARVRVVCDWVQYRENFREVVDVRPVLACSGGTGHSPADGMEIAVDLRRSTDVAIGELTGAVVHDPSGARVFLENWVPGSASCIWDFNDLYWSSLEMWEKATGRGYEQSLPGGQSDARNVAAARDLIDELFAVWDRLSASAALPEELYVVEFGVGNGHQARVFLDEFRARDAAQGRGYYRRLRYLMCDYSQHVLDLARMTVAEHAGCVSSFVLEATRPLTALGFLQHKVFLVYVSNMYDNLATDEVAQLGGRTYCVQTRAYLSPAGAAELAASLSTSPEELPRLVRKLLRLGPVLLADAAPEQFADADAAVAFWQRTWSLLRLEERYVPLGLDAYPLAASVSGETLRPLLESGADIRMHVSNGALSSFLDSLTLLHPFGRLVCHDLFVTDPQGYRTHFRGPGKYDGSVVNWVNGPLLAHVGRRRGFDVRCAPFRHRGRGNVMTLTAQVRD
jgi:hypothetical protein